MNAPVVIHAARARGWACIPVNGDKRPFFPWKHHQTTAPRSDQLEEWAERYRPHAWAVITGGVSRLVVLDFDGEEGLATLEQLGLKAHVQTPSGGRHWYGAYDHGSIRTLNGKSSQELGRLFPGLDVRAEGGYAVFWGRISTGEYRWLRPMEPDEMIRLPGPLLAHLSPGSPGSEASLLGQALIRAASEGRNNAGFWLARALRDAGLSIHEARPILLEYQGGTNTLNQKGIAEPYTEAEAIASLRQAYRRHRRAPDYSAATIPLTDYGNAQRLVRRHGRDLRYVHAWREWLSWDGQRWRRDTTGEVMRRAKETVRAIYAEASSGTTEEGRKAVAEHARRSEAEPRLRHMIELASSEPGVPVAPEHLDADPWLLNCTNGTVELRTGQLREQRREDLITKLAPAEFDPAASDPDWERVVSEACGGDPELVAFVGRAFGYSITGETSEEKLFFVHGPAASGKSTVIEAIKAALGEYAVTTDFETFLKRDQIGGPRNDIARLAGARLVSSLEVEHGKRLAEGLVKQLTGGDTVSARFLRQEFFEFKPQMKLWLAANHAPRVQSDDDAMWRRIVRIPFEHVIPEEGRDPSLKSKFRNSGAARSAVLAWLVRGTLAWQKAGLAVPQLVKQATAAYRDEMDPLQDFLRDRCVLEPGATTLSAELWAEYQLWAKDGGERWPLLRKRFGETLKAHGLQDVKWRGQRAWHGIRLSRRLGGENPLPQWTDETDPDATFDDLLPQSSPLAATSDSRVQSRHAAKHARALSSPPEASLSGRPERPRRGFGTLLDGIGRDAKPEEPPQ